MFLLGRNVSAQTALTWGLVNRVIAGADLRELLALREACFDSVDLRESGRAFAEKRRPRWSGH